MSGPIVPGEVVTLKSGGPNMTVEWIKDEQVKCVWFENAKSDSAMFKTVTLKLADKSFLTT